MTDTARIDDAGEKLGGARKDTAESGVPAPAEPSSNVLERLWPKPDFAEDVRNGITGAATAALFLVLYETLAPGPPEYFHDEPTEFLVEAHRHGVLFFRGAYESGRAWTADDLRHAYHADIDLHWTSASQRDRAPFCCGRKRGRITRHPLGQTLASRVRRDCLADLGWPWNPDVRTSDTWGAWIFHRKDNPGHDFWQPVRGEGSGVVFLEDTEYPTRDEAMAAAKRHFEQELVRRKEGNGSGGRRSKPPSRPKLDHPCERVGFPRRRDDSPVTTDQLMETFGFRGVEFGNWVSQAERQGMLDATFDALHDLCELLGMPPRFASLDGRLGIAFGSRGKGFLGGAAHFERDRWVMHVTKSQGSGALAHEFGHALDALLAVRNRPARVFMSDQLENWAWMSAEGVREAASVRDGEAIRQLAELFRELRPKPFGYFHNAQRNDGNRRKPYWAQPTEMFARMFEAWIFDRLVDLGRRNEYLVNGCGEDAGAQSWNLPYDPYPMGDERRTVGRKLAAFMDAFGRAWSPAQASSTTAEDSAAQVDGAGATSLVRHWKRDGADVYVGRGGPYGNPFEIGRDGTRDEVIAKFEAWIARNPDLRRMVRRELAGKTLGCWCAPRRCHGETLARIANDESQSSSDPVFVFGSNGRGRHGRGAALFALRHRHAVEGLGEGLQGNAYAIPTKDASLATLTIPEIEAGVQRFFGYAAGHPELAFDVTRIGCGLAGHRDDVIAALFKDAPANCRLPYVWSRLLDPTLPIRVIVAGTRTFEDYDLLASKLDHLLARKTGNAEIVSGGARGADTLGERYAVERGLHFLRLPAEWDRYGKKEAGPIRNQHMSFLASHLVAFWDGESRGTQGMIGIAGADNLIARVVNYGVQATRAASPRARR